jgi:hypothetical protein
MATAVEYDCDTLVRLLQEHSASFIKQFFRPEQDLYSLIKHCVAGNTFRAFHNCAQPPSTVFRRWAVSRLVGDWFALLGEAEAQQDYDKIIEAFADDLERQWLSEAKIPLAFGRGRKLRNLLMKHIVRWSGIPAADQGKLIGFLHVPLDEYSLIAFRRIAASGELGPKINIPKKPSMSFIKTPESYNQLQNLMQAVASQAKVPRISIDLVAWNLAHDKYGMR